MDRRLFLKKGLWLGGGLTTFPYATSFASQLVNGMIRNAQAEEISTSANSRIYLNLYFSGGPMRYTFDQWVKTNANETLASNAYVATAYKSSNGRVTGLDYKTFNYNGTEVPHMFSTQVFDGAGGKRNLSDLLNNMLVVRGFGTAFDGHDTNSLLVQTPVTGLPSMAGLLADSNEKLFAAVGGFISSNKNKVATPVGNKFLHGLFKSFEKNTSNNTSVSLKEYNQQTYDVAMGYLKNYARADRLGSKTIAKSLENASKKMRQGLGDIDSYWVPAVRRYQAAIEATVKQIGIPSISDMPIVMNGSGIPPELFSLFAYYRLHTQGLGEGQRDFIPAREWDLREMVQSMTLGDLGEQFAMAEYLIRGDYTPSVNLTVGNFYHPSLKTDLIADDPVNNAFNSTSRIDFAHTDMDSHTGAVPAVLITHNFYSAVMAGVLELKEKLSATQRAGTNESLWNETLVHVTSEFTRNAVASGTTTPHGYQQMYSSAFSGAIRGGPYMVGNILKSAHANFGTNGTMAPVGGSYPVKSAPGPAMMNSTICSLMRVASNPWENTAPSLIQFNETSGAISYPFGKGRIVDG